MEFLTKLANETMEILTDLTGKQWDTKIEGSPCVSSSNTKGIFTLVNPKRLKSFKMKGFSKDEEIEIIVTELAKKHKIRKASGFIPYMWDIDGELIGIDSCGKMPNITIMHNTFKVSDVTNWEKTY